MPRVSTILTIQILDIANLWTICLYVIYYLHLKIQNVKLPLDIIRRSVTYRYSDFQLKLFVDALRWLRGVL
jgi:hypothetical protein